MLKSVFIAALFMLAKKWKYFKCPSSDELINKMWYIHAKECYSAIKRKPATPMDELKTLC